MRSADRVPKYAVDLSKTIRQNGVKFFIQHYSHEPKLLFKISSNLTDISLV